MSTQTLPSPTQASLPTPPAPAAATAAPPLPTTRRQLAGRLLTITRPVLAPLGLSALFRLAGLLLGAALLGVGGWAVATRAAGQPTWPLGRVVGVLVGLALAKGLARYLEQYAGHYVAFRSLALLRNFFFAQLQPQAPAQTEGQDAGDLMSRVTKDVDRIEVFFAHTLVPLVTAVVAPLALLGYLGAATSWRLAFTLTPFLLLVGVVVPALGARATDGAARRLRVTRGQLAHHVTDSVQGVREVLAFGAQERRSAQLDRLEEQITRDLHITHGFIAARRGLNQALAAGALLTVFLVASAAVQAGQLTIGQLGLALGLSLGAFAPVLAVEDFAADLDQAFASARRVFAITDRPALVASPPRPRDAQADPDAPLRLRGVSFRYPGAEAGPERALVLRDVDLTIHPGRVTALVGASGSGKSTVAALLDRMWDPTSGRVTLGDLDLRELSLTHLRELVAYAPQRPHVFNDSVRANLLLARPAASDAELAAVCEQVGLSQWLASEPAGLDTVVGELGERLSGGQRQRLALARALLRRSPITILDEATSQLDADTEAQVLAGIRAATAGRTLVVIAHRLSTVADADHIVVLDAGRVVEEGTFAELMARDGAFAALRRREG